MSAARNELEADRYLSINIGTGEYGLLLTAVREVIAMPEITPVPNSPPHCLGVINLRGQIVPLIDLRLKFKVKAKNEAETTVIICDFEGRHIGAVVDSVNSVVNVDSSSRCELPTTNGLQSMNCFSGVYRAQDRLVLLVDLDEALKN